MQTRTPIKGVKVIVTDAETRLGLYVIRALGRAGCLVTALSREPKCRRVLGFSSRFVSEQHRIPFDQYEETLVSLLEKLADRHDVVVPVSTLSITILSQYASKLQSKIRFYVPDTEVLLSASDKAVTTRIAKQAGIPVPETYYDLDPSKVEQWALDMDVQFPLVIKFANDFRNALWEPGERYRIVRSVRDLGQEYRRMHSIGPFPLVQEYINGKSHGYFTIATPEGEPLVAFCHRRLREYPISGGPSTLCESIYDKRLVGLGSRMVRAIKLKGVSMVEFKYDRASDQYYFLEINPRFWGSLPLALQCGLNFPMYQVEMALGMNPSVRHEYNSGVRLRFLFADALAIWAAWRGGSDATSAMDYISELFDLSIKDGLIDKDDWRPAITYVLSHLGR